METYRSDEAWNALGDPSRRAIVACLAERPRAVGELADTLPISRPAVSQHLKVLEGAGLVTCTKRGTRNLYAVQPDGLAVLRLWLDGFWDDALIRFKAAAEGSD